MTRFKITVEYDGTGLAGWQKQENGPSVQAALEAAAARLAGQAIEVTGAGRTDAGVHASGQVAHLDIEKELGPDAVRDGLNFWLREGGTHAIVVLAAEIAAIATASSTGAFHRRSTASGSGGCRSPSTRSGWAKRRGC
jgi:tRNA pseudouridine38-40 synthase